MDDEFLETADQFRAQVLIQQMWKVFENMDRSTERGLEANPKRASAPPEEIEGSKTTKEDIHPDITEPACDAKTILKKLLSNEHVDITAWRFQHMHLAEQHPKQHQNCHRIVWRIVDVLESGHHTQDEIITLMRDVRKLSEGHAFNFSRSSEKLTELLVTRSSLSDSIEVVSIQRDLLRSAPSGDELAYWAGLLNALGLVSQKSSSLIVLEEQISLLRQLLFLEPGNAASIERLRALLLKFYDHTSNSEALYEAQAVGEEIAQRSNQNACCAVLSDMESEFEQCGVFEEIELWVPRHRELLRRSPSSHASCPERLLKLFEDAQSTGMKPEELVIIAYEALYLVDRGIGISNQLKALSVLRSALVATSTDQDTGSLYSTIRRIHTLLSPTEHRISGLSWLTSHSIPTNPKPSRQDSLDWRQAAIAFDAIAQVADDMPGLAWVNPALAMHNGRARPPLLMEDIEDDLRRKAIQLGNPDHMPEKSPERAQSLTAYAATMLASNRTDQINLVITMLYDAVETWGVPLSQPIPPGHPARETLGLLGHTLSMRHWHFGHPEDVDNSVNILRYCLAGASEDERYRGLLALSSSLEARYRCLGNVNDIGEALDIAEKLRVGPKAIASANIYVLRQAGKAADCLFDAVGGIQLLDHAASIFRQALRLASNEHPLMASLASLLGSILRKRFSYLLMPNDLVVSQQLTRYAVGLQEKDENAIHQDLPHNRAILGETILAQFEKDPKQEYIDSALSLFQLILEQGKDSDADRADAYYRVGNAFRIRNQTDDLANAILYLRNALLVQSDTRHTRYPIWLTGLSSALLVEFTQTGQSGTIEEALKLSETAASFIPDKSTIRAEVYAQLGEVQYAVFQSQGNHENLEHCLMAYQIAASSPSSPRPQCLKHARRWESIALKHRHKSLWAALNTSLNHQTKFAGIGQTIQARHEYLSKDPVPASRAAARAIEQENLEGAIEYLEHGRSILWRQTLELRSSLEALRDTSPSLADQLAAVVEELDDIASIQSVSEYSSSFWGVKDPDRILRYNRELADQYDSLLDEIRQLEGFRDFLRPFRFSDTDGIAAEGPVIVVNLCDHRCDAIIFIESEVQHVPLPADFNDLLIARNNITNAAAQIIYDKGAQMDSTLPPVLRTLWSSVVEPILDFLKSRGPIPLRVFWCIAGLSDLPIHAAGLYKRGSPSLPDIVVSSYTPTISALIRARQARAKSSFETPRVLAVAQTETGGFAPLPYAIEEVEVMKNLGIVTTALVNYNVFLNPIESYLRDHSWIHLCCHGTTNAELPLLSAFHLSGGTLNMESIMRMNLPLADFAFLSACHSAEASVAHNENMSLASAMQVAGFRSIVATMYAIGDDEGPIVAQCLYEHLFRNQSERVDSSEASVGLNKAIRTLRRAKVPMHRWVPFIHIGV